MDGYGRGGGILLGAESHLCDPQRGSWRREPCREGEFLDPERSQPAKAEKRRVAEHEGLFKHDTHIFCPWDLAWQGTSWRPPLALDHACDKGLFGNSGDGFQPRPSTEAVPAAQKSFEVAQAHTSMHFPRPRPGQDIGRLQNRLPAAGPACRDKKPAAPIGVITQPEWHYRKSSHAGMRP